MKILFATRRYKPFAGGAENQMARVAEALRKRNHTVRVLTGRFDRSLLPAEEKLGVMIKRLPDPGIRIIGTIVFLLYLIREMLRRDTYDAVITSMINETSAVAVLLAKIMRKKVFFRVSSKSNFRQKKLYRKLVFLADGMIAQTDDLRQAAISAGYPAERITVIHNMICEAAFAERTERSPILRILWCGRLHAIKNPMLLPDIAQRLKDAGIAFHIDVVGDGGLRPALEAAISAGDLNHCFTLHGFQKDTQPFYQNAGLYLLTSDSDAMPNTVLEAMMAALPIVAAAVDGVPLLVRDEHEALLFPRGDADAAFEKIKRFYQDPALGIRTGTQARERARKLFSEQRIVQEYESLLMHPAPDIRIRA